MRVPVALLAFTLVAAACGSGSGVEVTNSDSDTTDAPAETIDDDTFTSIDESDPTDSGPDSTDGEGNDEDNDGATSIESDPDSDEPGNTEPATTDNTTEPVDTNATGTTPAGTNPPTTDPVTTDPETTDPVTTEANNGEPPTSDAPTVTTSADDNDAEFPPSGADWADHPFASLIPTPSELGDPWQYSDGDVVEAAPSDPDDVIPGCDVEPPPTLAGIDVTFESNLFDELEVGLAEGTTQEAEAFMVAVRELTQCEFDEDSFGDARYELDDAQVDGADESAILKLTLSFDPEADEALLVAVAVARYDGFVTTVFMVTEGTVDDDPADQIDLVVDLSESIAANR